jgi:hypothetical protein
MSFFCHRSWIEEGEVHWKKGMSLARVSWLLWQDHGSVQSEVHGLAEAEENETS